MDEGNFCLCFLLTVLVGWWSVTPEVLAQHTAERFYEALGPNALVIDAMTGKLLLLFCVNFLKV